MHREEACALTSVPHRKEFETEISFLQAIRVACRELDISDAVLFPCRLDKQMLPTSLEQIVSTGQSVHHHDRLWALRST